MATLGEVLRLAVNATRGGRPLGVYVETKGPAYHERLGLALEGRLLDAPGGGRGTGTTRPRRSSCSPLRSRCARGREACPFPVPPFGLCPMMRRVGQL